MARSQPSFLLLYLSEYANLFDHMECCRLALCSRTVDRSRRVPRACATGITDIIAARHVPEHSAHIIQREAHPGQAALMRQRRGSSMPYKDKGYGTGLENDQVPRLPHLTHSTMQPRSFHVQRHLIAHFFLNICICMFNFQEDVNSSIRWHFGGVVNALACYFIV
ncbi:hypothetical protein CC86DRAFT_102805 [Ophiobolus disseminans]|uniref:Uncharacterized protein n=1 Tax=Ophiobolus disseminans TaxID=1469910 RepID=A0A6A6ZM67_9PLEO|nr:hypothetical protein CC86DRAFT_102805 [Ophiobolus disseminans]